MRRREFITLLGGAAAAWPLGVRAQQTDQMKRIGVLLPTSPAYSARFIDALRQGLRELGHVEGQDIAIEARFGNGAIETLPALAAELAALNPACIVAGSDRAVLASRKATTSIPIVMGGISGDPVLLGLAASFARPAANVTGLTLSIVNASGDLGLAGKQIELLRELRPGLARIGVVFNPDDLVGKIYWKSAQEAARILKIECFALEVRQRSELEGAFATGKREGLAALLIPISPSLTSVPDWVVPLVAQAGLPAIYGQRDFVVAGGLISYNANLVDIWRRTANFVDKILKGVKPGDLPIEQPTKFELVINLKTAKALGLTVPQSLLVAADEVIE
jgi:putative tryptophan/tyrosine transport system substrate-binding protein